MRQTDVDDDVDVDVDVDDDDNDDGDDDGALIDGSHREDIVMDWSQW